MPELIYQSPPLSTPTCGWLGFHFESPTAQGFQVRIDWQTSSKQKQLWLEDLPLWNIFLLYFMPVILHYLVSALMLLKLLFLCYPASLVFEPGFVPDFLVPYYLMLKLKLLLPRTVTLHLLNFSYSLGFSLDIFLVKPS